ncbi:MAG: PucR family transcriptional regulator [Lachnospiraceae bacterium]
MKIEDLLKLDSMQGSRVVTHNCDLSAPITGVNVMEVPDIINWVKKGEYLMTAGYSYRNKPEDFALLVPQLAEKGVVALGIKAHRFFEHIPEQVIEQADACGLPVIEIGEEVVFSNVVRQVIETIIAEDNNSLTNMLLRVTELSEIILGGSGLTPFVKRLSEYMDNPVILQRENGDCITYGLMGEEAYTPCNEDFSIFSGTEKQGWIKICIGVKEYKAYYYNMIHQQERLACIYIIEKNTGIQNDHIHLLEQCSYMVGMELLSEAVRKRVEMKYVDQFLRNWILGKIEDGNSLKMQSEVSGLTVRSKEIYKVAVLRTLKNLPEDRQKAAAVRLRKNMQTCQDFYVTHVNEEILLVFPENREEEYVFQVLELSKTIFSGMEVQLCVGKTAKEVFNLYDSYKDACNIAKVSKRYKLKDKVLNYRNTGVYSLLYMIPLGKELDDYLDIYIRPLVQYDEKHQTNMLATLKVYLDTKGNAKATAERLFMHYNTIGYRLERISQIMGMDISDHEIQFCLDMAIKIYDMYL